MDNALRDPHQSRVPHLNRSFIAIEVGSPTKTQDPGEFVGVFCVNPKPNVLAWPQP